MIKLEKILNKYFSDINNSDLFSELNVRTSLKLNNLRISVMIQIIDDIDISNAIDWKKLSDCNVPIVLITGYPMELSKNKSSMKL